MHLARLRVAISVNTPGQAAEAVVGAVDVVADKGVAVEAAKDKAKTEEWDVARKAATPIMAAAGRDPLRTMAAVAKPSSHNNNASHTQTQSNATTTGTSATPADSTWRIGTPVPPARTHTAATTTKKMSITAIGVEVGGGIQSQQEGNAQDTATSDVTGRGGNSKT